MAHTIFLLNSTVFKNGSTYKLQPYQAVYSATHEKYTKRRKKVAPNYDIFSLSPFPQNNSILIMRCIRCKIAQWRFLTMYCFSSWIQRKIFPGYHLLTAWYGSITVWRAFSMYYLIDSSSQLYKVNVISALALITWTQKYRYVIWWRSHIDRVMSQS